VSGRLGRARADLRLLARAAAITVSATPGAAVGSLVLAVAQAFASIGGVWLTKVIVDRLAAGGDATGPALLYGATLLFAATAEPIKRVLAALVEERAVGEVDRRSTAWSGRRSATSLRCSARPSSSCPGASSCSTAPSPFL
jgi:hypothetical protein